LGQGVRDYFLRGAGPRSRCKLEPMLQDGVSERLHVVGHDEITPA
jgi:hypothetical protein